MLMMLTRSCEDTSGSSSTRVRVRHVGIHSVQRLRFLRRSRPRRQGSSLRLMTMRSSGCAPLMTTSSQCVLGVGCGLRTLRCTRSTDREESESNCSTRRSAGLASAEPAGCSWTRQSCARTPTASMNVSIPTGGHSASAGGSKSGKELSKDWRESLRVNVVPLSFERSAPRMASS